MKSIFDTPVKNELINRVNSVSQQNNAQWGKMNIYQMLRHCTLCNGRLAYKYADHHLRQFGA